MMMNVEVAMAVLLIGDAAGVGAELGVLVLLGPGILNSECGFAVQLFC